MQQNFWFFVSSFKQASKLVRPLLRSSYSALLGSSGTHASTRYAINMTSYVSIIRLSSLVACLAHLLSGRFCLFCCLFQRSNEEACDLISTEQSMGMSKVQKIHLFWELGPVSACWQRKEGQSLARDRKSCPHPQLLLIQRCCFCPFFPFSHSNDSSHSTALCVWDETILACHEGICSLLWTFSFPQS